MLKSHYLYLILSLISCGSDEEFSSENPFGQTQLTAPTNGKKEKVIIDLPRYCFVHVKRGSTGCSVGIRTALMTDMLQKIVMTTFLSRKILLPITVLLYQLGYHRTQTSLAMQGLT